MANTNENVKTYNVTNRRSPQLRAAIKNTIETHEFHAKSHFWRPAKTKLDRSFLEFQFRTENPSYQIKSGKDQVRVSLVSLNNYVKLGLIPAHRMGNAVLSKEDEVYAALTRKPNNSSND